MRRARRVDGCGQLVLEERTLVSPGSSEMMSSVYEFLSSVYEFLSTTVPERDTKSKRVPVSS